MQAPNWTAEKVIDAAQRWHAKFDEPPSTADWNPALARKRDRVDAERLREYREGSYPSTNSAKKPFGGSWAKMIHAAGFKVRKPGGGRRAPVSATETVTADSPEARLAIVERQVKTLQQRTLGLERSAGVAAPETAQTRKRAGTGRDVRDAKAELKDVEADRARVKRELATTVEQRDRYMGELKALAEVSKSGNNGDGAEELREAQARAADLDERVNGLVGELREARSSMRSAQERARVAEQRARPAPETGKIATAIQRAELAERRQADAERRLGEMEKLLTSGLPIDDRKIATLRDERQKGNGPGVVSQALAALTLARKSGDRRKIRAALRNLAAAAEGWRDLIDP